VGHPVQLWVMYNYTLYNNICNNSNNTGCPTNHDNSFECLLPYTVLYNKDVYFVKKFFARIYMFYFDFKFTILWMPYNSFIILFDIKQFNKLWKKTFKTIYQLPFFVGHPVLYKNSLNWTYRCNLKWVSNCRVGSGVFWFEQKTLLTFDWEKMSEDYLSETLLCVDDFVYKLLYIWKLLIFSL